MSFKPVLLHSCRGTAIDVGQPLVCRCQRHITFKRADRLVKDGHALRRSLPSGLVNYREIILVRHKPLRPVRTISAQDIQNAYVLMQERARRRIEIYGGQHE